jgi:hypothetical protein
MNGVCIYLSRMNANKFLFQITYFLFKNIIFFPAVFKDQTILVQSESWTHSVMSLVAQTWYGNNAYLMLEPQKLKYNNTLIK